MRTGLPAALVVAGILALSPVVARAEMGPAMGPGTGSEMGQRSLPAEKRDDAAPRRSTTGQQVAAPAQGPMSQPMEHPAVSRPFYEERSFLVLAGVSIAVGGLVLYRFVRTRSRRRLGPARFVTEAVLVVDLADSTHLATHYGDGLAMRARTVVKDRTLAAAGPHGLVFAENTGDGYFMTFSSVAGAVQTALTLLRDLKERPPDLSPGPLLEVRAAVTYGEILLDARGVRHGAVINKAFRLEGLTAAGFVRLEGGLRPDGIPGRNRIFLDEAAAEESRTAGIALRSLGFASLKGFAGLHGVSEVPS